MDTRKSEAKRIWIDLYEEDYKRLQQLKVYYGLQVHDLLHMIISKIYKRIHLYDNSGEAQTAAGTVTYQSGARRKGYSKIGPTESDYPDEATYEVSKYDYTYYPGEVKQEQGHHT